MKLDHIQLAMPQGSDERARSFFRDVLGMVEEEKPYPLNQRGGCWFKKGSVILHLGVEKGFVPQKKAHPAFLADDLERLEAKLRSPGFPVKWDEALADRTRFYTEDPFGNRIEFMKQGDGFSER